MPNGGVIYFFSIPATNQKLRPLARFLKAGLLMAVALDSAVEAGWPRHEYSA